MVAKSLAPFPEPIGNFSLLALPGRLVDNSAHRNIRHVLLPGDVTGMVMRVDVSGGTTVDLVRYQSGAG